MNIFPAPTERDQEYKAYFSVFKSSARIISGDVSRTVYNDWMRNVVAKFPYFVHTNARIMAIASFMASIGRNFNTQRARELIGQIFTTQDDTNRKLLVLDVRRYFERLIS